jgi:MFS family permease
VSKPIGLGGKAVLTIGHMAGMIDMVALPLWIGGLMQHYRFSPQHAGITVTLFLLGMVIASAVLAPLFNRVPRRFVTVMGFALATACFLLMARQPIEGASFELLAPLHALAGLGTGCGLSLVHGSIGRTDNPHRLFGMVNLAVAVLGIGVFAAVPGLAAQYGASVLFLVFAVAMGLAAVVSLIGFPDLGDPAPLPAEGGVRTASTTSRLIWMPIAVVICLTLNQSMVFAFVERIGAARGFGAGDVQAVLVTLGFVNLLPGRLDAAPLVSSGRGPCRSRRPGDAGAHPGEFAGVCTLRAGRCVVRVHGDLHAHLPVWPALEAGSQWPCHQRDTGHDDDGLVHGAGPGWFHRVRLGLPRPGLGGLPGVPGGGGAHGATARAAPRARRRPPAGVRLKEEPWTT